MILTFLVISAQSRDLFTKLMASDSGKCTEKSPCSYDKASEEMKKDDYLFFDDVYVERPDEIEQVRAIMNKALNEGVVILSNKMTINGTFYSPKSLAFIMIQTSHNVEMHNFYFTGFRNTILCIRKSNKNIIGECTFAHNYPIKLMGLVMIGSGKTSITECKFIENSILNSSLISLHSAFLYIRDSAIERNFVEHESSQSLLYSINSIVEHTRTSIRDNSSPFSPLYKFEYINKIGFWNCTWQNNHQKELMVCDGKCKFNFTDGIINNNHGTILKTSDKPTLTIKSTKIINNFGQKAPLFDIPAGLVRVSDSTKFFGNYGTTLFNTKFSDMKCDIKIIDSIFKNNNFESSVLSAGNGTSHIENCYFLGNSAHEGIVEFEEAKAIITSSTFRRSAGISILFKNSIGYVDGCLFTEGTGRLGNAVTATGGRSSVISSTFEGSAIGGHLLIDLPRHLSGLMFTTGEDDALGAELRRECYLCSYHFTPPARASLFTFAGPGVLIAIIITFVISFFRSEIMAVVVRFFAKDK